MADDQQLDHLISVLYEAVLDPSRWREAVGLCGLYAGGVDAQMTTIDKKHNTLVATQSVMAGTAFAMESGADYINYYLNIDPRTDMMLNAAADEWTFCNRFHSQRFVDHNEFYQNFLIPGGVRYTMTGKVDDNPDTFTVFGGIRAVGQQPFDDANLLAAKRFSGHLQRALRLQKHTQDLQVKAELGAMAIDALALAMLIVDGNGLILHLNAEAERLLQQRTSGLLCKTGRLTAADPVSRHRLMALLSSATASSAVGGAMCLAGLAGRQVFVTPLPAASPFARNWQTPLALVLVMEAGKNLSTLQWVGKLYDLSPAELRVASALLKGLSPEEYALEAGVTLHTVRSQLKSLFAKTGTRRQSELVAVLSNLPPLRSS